MSETSVVTASFPTLDAARAARRRLAQAGFARNSINIERLKNDFEVGITTSAENRQRVERILCQQTVRQSVDQATTTGRDLVLSNPVLSLGLAALAGFALFTFTNRR